MKKKYALYKLCGFNLLYIFFAVFTFWGFQPSGMFLSFVRDTEIADLMPFIMNFLIMPYLIVISYCCVFMFYYLHKNALDVLPYKKADIFRAIFRMAGILLLLVMISKSVGLTRQLEYSFMLSPYYNNIFETEIQQILCWLSIIAEALAGALFTVFFTSYIMRRRFSSVYAYVFTSIIAGVILALPCALIVTAIKYIPLNIISIVCFAVFIIAEFIVVHLCYKKEESKLL